MKKLLLIVTIICLTTGLSTYRARAEESPPPDPDLWDGETPEPCAEYTFSGGQGTDQDPFLISSAADLAQLSANMADDNTYEGKHFRLTTDLVLQHRTSDGDLCMWSPIGSQNRIFKGHFDGCGHTIAGLYISGGDYLGLFGRANGSIIENIVIENAQIRGGQRVGSIVGYLAGGQISHCQSSGSLEAQTNGGGIVGHGQQGIVIDSCLTDMTISGGKNLGGIAGNISGGQISACSSASQVLASDNHSGGIVGYASDGTELTVCTNWGPVEGDDRCGGIVGYLAGGAKIIDCCNCGAVKGQTRAGGIAGHLPKGGIHNCYNGGLVSAAVSRAGGIVGSIDADGQVQYGLSTATVTAPAFAGSIAGSSAGTINSCYYDRQMSPLGGIDDNDSAGAAEGLLTAEMTGTALQGCLGHEADWLWTDSIYPRLQSCGDSSAAQVAAAAILLRGDDHVLAVHQDFTVGSTGGVSWNSSDEDVISVNGTTATVVRQDQDRQVTLTASSGQASRSIELTVIAAEPEPIRHQVQLTGIEIQDRQYDGTLELDCEISTALGLQLKPGETGESGLAGLTLNGEPRLTLIDPHAGQTRPVAVTGISLEGAGAEDYELDYTNLSVNIEPRPAELLWTDWSAFVYDHEEKSVSASIVNMAGSDQVEVTAYSGTRTAAAAGEYQVAASAVSNSDYTLAGGINADCCWCIEPAEPSLSLADKTVTATGGPIEIDPAVVRGVAGGDAPGGLISYEYYLDAGLNTKLNNEDAPVAPGVYFVRAKIAAHENYRTATSGVAVLTIEPRPGNPDKTDRSEQRPPAQLPPPTKDGSPSPSADDAGQVPSPDPGTGIFTDLKEDHWCLHSIKYVQQAGLMNGTSSACFEPELAASRSMAATVLWRLMEQPLAASDNIFADAEPGSWYFSAVNWAQANGIVYGSGDGRFKPHEILTREQLALMLHRLSILQAIAPGEDDKGILLEYTDAGDISAYAQEAMAWAVSQGILTGYPDRRLAPAMEVTRAQLAAATERLSRLIDGAPPAS